MNHMRFKVAVAAAFAAAIGVSSAAAAPYHGVKASLNYGTLIVKGTQGSDKIALRLKAGDSSMLEVDTGDEGSAEFSFPRADVARIVVDGGECPGRESGTGARSELGQVEVPHLAETERLGNGEGPIPKLRLGREHLNADPVLRQRPQSQSGL